MELKVFCLNVALESPSRQYSSAQIHSSPNPQDVDAEIQKSQNWNILKAVIDPSMFTHVKQVWET